MVLPYRGDLFRGDCVDIVPGSDWGERYERVMARAKVRVVSSHKLGDGGVSYDYADQVLHGLARMHAGQLGVSLTHLALWDGRAGDGRGRGGTASTVGRWRRAGFDVTVIGLPATAPRRGVRPKPRRRPRRRRSRRRRRPKPPTS